MVSLGRLYLVVKCDVSAIFKVYKLYEKRRKWVKINSIGARVFFFGLDFFFSVSARKLSFQNDCILFKQHSFRSYNGKVDDKHVFCNSLRHDLYVGLCNLNEPTLVGAVEISPGLSHTLWPPPAWFWPTNRLERMKTVVATVDEILVRVTKSLECVMVMCVVATARREGKRKKRAEKEDKREVAMRCDNRSCLLTKFQDPTVEGIGASYDNFRRQVCLMHKHIHDFKATLDKAKAIEHEIEALSIDWLHRMERLRVRKDTGSARIEESQRATEYNSCTSLQRWVWCTVSRLDTTILEAESCISYMVWVYNILGIGIPLRINEMGQIEAVVVSYKLTEMCNYSVGMELQCIRSSNH